MTIKRTFMIVLIVWLVTVLLIGRALAQAGPSPVIGNGCLVDYTAVILASISMLGNVLLGYLTLKYRAEVNTPKE